jgi:Leucine-rich repeat (LRR) protein
MKLFFSTFFSFLLFYSISFSDVPLSERNALIALYDSTDGDNWTTKTNWKSASDVSTWYGVTVVSDHVTEIILTDNNLVGFIPTKIDSLTELKVLDLSQNSGLSGSSIPSEIGNLSNLEELNLGFDDLSGTIPNSIWNLSNLVKLILEENDLSGSIPEDIENLTNIELINLSFNELEDTLPNKFDALTNLKYLQVNDNKFDGYIPSSLGSCSLLEYLDLSNQEYLEGEIPDELFNLSNLEVFILSENEIEGEISSDIDNLSNLKILLLDNNLITGVIPPEIGNLASLERLELHNNPFSPSNEIPSSFGDLSNLRILKLDNDSLSGTIPTSFDDLTNLEELTLSNNEDLDGDIINYALNNLNLRILNVSNCNFSGTLPYDIETLDSLRELNLSDNDFSGTIPYSLGNLEYLHTLNLSSNSFNGNIPGTLSQIDSLLILYLMNNNLNGSFPDSLLSCPVLIELRLENNNISGSLPTFGSSDLQDLKVLNVSHNSMTGNIPTSIENLSELTELNLGHNNFSGTIPSSIGNLSNLIYLYLNRNGLSGAVPTEIGNLLDLEVLDLDSNGFNSVPNQLNNLTKLQILAINKNNIVTLPTDLSGISDLRAFYVANNLIVDLPSYSGMFDSLQTFDVRNNYLTFEDIIPNLEYENDYYIIGDSDGDGETDTTIYSRTFLISPQQNLPIICDGNKDVGQTFSLTIIAGGGTDNLYVFLKDGYPVRPWDSVSNTLTITNLDFDDAGVYSCHVYNRNLINYADNSEENQQDTIRLILISDNCDLVVKGAPTVLTKPMSSIEMETAISGGVIVSNGGYAITQKGVCWSTDPNPDITDNITNNGTGDNEYDSFLSGLTANTLYYLRAYATNSFGTSYGAEIVFATPDTNNLVKIFDLKFSLDSAFEASNSSERCITRSIDANSQSNFIKNIAASFIKNLFDEYFPDWLANIGATIIDWWGYAPLQMSLGLRVDAGICMQFNQTEATQVNVDYPISYTIEYPQPKSFGCGDTIEIKTLRNIGLLDQNSFVVDPPFYETQLSGTIKDLKLGGSFKFCTPKGPCIDIPYWCPTWSDPWKVCWKNICFPPAICSPTIEYWYSVFSAFDIDPVNFPIVTLCPRVFEMDDNALNELLGSNELCDSLFDCVTSEYDWQQGIWQELCSNDYIGLERDDDDPNKIIMSFNIPETPEFYFFVSNPTPDNLQYQTLQGGNQLRRFSNPKEVLGVQLDLVSLLDYFLPPIKYKSGGEDKELELATSISIGPFSLDIGDISPTYSIDQSVDYNFEIRDTTTIALGRKLFFAEWDPATQSIVGTWQYDSIASVKSGNSIKLIIPDEQNNPIPVSPTFQMGGVFNSMVKQTDWQSLYVAILQISLSGVFDFTLYEKTFAKILVNTPSPIDNGTYNLDNTAFSIEGFDDDPFSLIPEKPKLEITQMHLLKIYNIGNGYRRAGFRFKLENTGNVPLHDVGFYYDLDSIFHGSRDWYIHSLTSWGYDVNPNYDGDEDVNLLPESTVLDSGDYRIFDIYVDVLPAVPDLDASGCFEEVRYISIATAEGTSPLGRHVWDGKQPCLDDELYPELVGNYPLVVDTNMGAVVINDYDDLTLYGRTNVKFIPPFSQSEGSVISGGRMEFRATSINSGSNTIRGDIISNEHLFIDNSNIYVDDAMIAGSLFLDPNSNLITYGGYSDTSDCVNLPEFPSVNISQVSSSTNVTVPSRTTVYLRPGNYNRIDLNLNSRIIFSAGTYRINTLNFLGNNIILYFNQNYNNTQGAVNVNVLYFNTNNYRSMRFLTENGLIGNSIFRYKGSNNLNLNKIKFDNGYIQAIIIAPNAEVTFDNSSRLYGAVYANKIIFGNNSLFQYYKLIDESGIVPKLPDVEQNDYVLTLEDLIQMNSSPILSAYPNPFSGKTLISFNLDEQEFARVAIIDMTGKEVAVLADGILNAGLNIFTLEPDNLPSGSYFCTLRTKDRNEMYKLIYLPDKR